jgi:hypothetical protein
MWRRLADLLLGWLCLSHTALAFLDPNPAGSSANGNHVDMLLDQMAHRMTMMEDLHATKITALQADMNNKDVQISSLQTDMNTKDSQIASLQQTTSSLQNTLAMQGRNILQ